MKVFITGAKGYDNKQEIVKLLKGASQLIAGPSMGVEELAVEVAEKSKLSINYDFYSISGFIQRYNDILNCVKKGDGKVICIEPGAEEEDKIYVIEECKRRGITYELLN